MNSPKYGTIIHFITGVLLLFSIHTVAYALNTHDLEYRDILLMQIPDTITAIGYRCQLDTVFPDEADVAEDIQVTGNGWQIDSITSWWVTWGGFYFHWDSVPNVHFIIYEDSSGQPCDSPMMELILEPVSYAPACYLPPNNYRLDITFPVPVHFSPGTWWIEVQPSLSSYPNTGFLGILSQVGIGNGQDFYFRYPYIGVPNWSSATQQFGQPLEAGFVLHGSTLGDYHDIATEEILAPAEYIVAGCTLNPEALFWNHGTVVDTFDACFVIDSASTNVYSETAEIILDASLDTVVQFPAWVAAETGDVVYDVTVYCVLVTDQNTANDTLTATTITSEYVWIIYDSLPRNTYSNEVVYTEATGSPEVYSLGGRGAYFDIFTFDCDVQEWDSTETPLLVGVWMSCGGSVGDKIYVIGGAEGMSFFEVDYNQEFDPVGQAVVLKEPMPTARYAHRAVVWQDTLIYVMGGRVIDSTYDVVEIYSPVTDTWITGSPLPIPNFSFACGISGDTIYIAGGRNDTHLYISDAWMGIIDPANPASITWTSLPDIPVGPSGQPGRSHVSGAVCDGKFYITGGADHGFTANDAWCYDPHAGTWIQCPDKPTSMAVCGAVYVPGMDGGTFLCVGGYLNNAGVYATEGLTNLTYGIEEVGSLPSQISAFILISANPAVKNVDITYAITQPGHVTLKVYDEVGRKVQTLVDAVRPLGTHKVHWQLDDMVNGVYFIRLETAEQTATRKIVVLK
jgi:hypothetical protein